MHAPLASTPSSASEPPARTHGFEPLATGTYRELRRMARNKLRRERNGHTLSATGLVHEAWLRLAGPRGGEFVNRAHFFGAAAEAMRRVLVDHARSRAALKRDVGRVDPDLAGDPAGDFPDFDELIAVHSALEDLAALSERAARVVECRYFAGLTIPETAEALGISHATVSEDWRLARAWLHRTLATPEHRSGI